jgi:hypothetical protein
VKAGSPSDYSAQSGLWIARANGTGAHRVAGLHVSQLIGWSTSADLLAVTQLRRVHWFFGWTTAPTEVDLVSSRGGIRRLFTLPRSASSVEGSIWDAVWSPNGRSLAISTYAPARTSGTVVEAILLADPRRRTTWFSIRNPQRMAGLCSPHGCVPIEVIADLAGWFPHWGIAFWVFSSGATHNSDATPLARIARPGARPQVVAQTLSNRIADALAVGPPGKLALVTSSSSGGFQMALGKTVDTCDPTTTRCTAIPRASVWPGRVIPGWRGERTPRRGAPGSGVSLEPAWSPDGDELAYVKAPSDVADATPSASWYVEHYIYIYDPGTGASRRLPTTQGAQLPVWSRDGRHLLYVADDGIWLTRTNGGKAVEIEHPLFPEREWNAIGPTDDTFDVDYYGQIPWSAQFDWYSS